MRVHPEASSDDDECASAPPAKAPRLHAAAAGPPRATAWATAEELGAPPVLKKGSDSLVYYEDMVRTLEAATLEDDAEKVFRETWGDLEEPADSPPLASSSTPPEAPSSPPEASGEPAPSSEVGFFTRQPSDAPYLYESAAVAAAAEAAVTSLAAALAPAPPPGTPRDRALGAAPQKREPQRPRPPPESTLKDASRLAHALSDARLLGTPLFTSVGGRARLRRMLCAIRSSGHPHLARGVLQALVAALQAPPPGEWTPAAAEVVVDHAFALLLAGTAEAPRTAHDLFAIDWETAARLVGRVQMLGGELGAAPGALRPKALLFSAMLHDRYDKGEEAMGLYFEAWAELVRRQLVPGPLEAMLIPALADIHYAYGVTHMGQHIATKAYSLRGYGPVARYSLYLVKHLEVISLRSRRQIAQATTVSREALALVEGLGPDYALAHARVLSIYAQNLHFFGGFHMAAIAWVRALRALVALRDPSLADVDFVPHQLVPAAIERLSAVARSRALTVVSWLVAKADPAGESPMAAHVHFHRAETLVEMGKLAKALEHYESALQIYRGRFGDHFPEENARVRRIRSAILEIRASHPAEDSPRARPGFLSRLFSRPRRESAAAGGSGPRPAPHASAADGAAASVGRGGAGGGASRFRSGRPEPSFVSRPIPPAH